MREIKVQEAVGQILCHDITQIVRGVVKDARFRKGHVITAEDIPELLKLGKENIFVWENDESKLHENDAAEILRELTQGENLTATDVKEGKIELKAACDGVFHVDADRLNSLNELGEICIATLPNKIPVRKNKSVAGMRVIPLVIDVAKMNRVREIAGDVPLMKILPYKNFKVGLVVTGSEIYRERIQDTFTPVIEAKLKTFGLQIAERRLSDDSKEMSREKISELLDLGCEMILCTGGMSVDPDDRTPAAIILSRNASDRFNQRNFFRLGNFLRVRSQQLNRPFKSYAFHYSSPPTPSVVKSFRVKRSPVTIRGKIKSKTVFEQNITQPGKPIIGTSPL